MTTKYIIRTATQLTGESIQNAGEQIETIYGLHDGSSYLSDAYDGEDEADEMAAYINENKPEIAPVKVQEICVFENEDGEKSFFYK